MKRGRDSGRGDGKGDTVMDVDEVEVLGGEGVCSNVEDDGEGDDEDGRG